VQSNAEPVRKNVEHAGHPYHALQRLRAGLDTAEGVADAAAADEKKKRDREKEEAQRRASSGEGVSGFDDSDYYSLLGLGERRFRATEDEIKKVGSAKFRDLGFRVQGLLELCTF
jgi:DnaJ family protein C protein 2